ncbi:MAG: hypothetical protein BWY93_02019 [Euryarchaeota archaeon ADurb.BinA087]|nr:MAG: hypothetical protein BWY93_02019 [Euryarchaeota archaeon ADurb.BinA087]
MGVWASPPLIKRGESPQSSITALVIDAGVGQPVGVSGRTGMLVIFPQAISSASRMGVRSVFSGLGPAPEMPGTTESIVLARILQKRGFFALISGLPVTNAISTRSNSSHLP